MKAEITDIANRHPLTTLFASLLAVAAVAGFASGASRESAPASEPAAIRAAAADASPAYEAAPDSGCEKLEEIAPESVTTVIEK